MFFHLIQHKERDTSESGFVLVLAMVVLLVISLLGIWALNTSDFELKVAGGSQQVERQFNVAEGGGNAEAVGVGFSQKSFYRLSNLTPGLLIPTTDADFDPGNDTPNLLANITAADPTTWPWGNLLNATLAAGQAASANEFDYRYLVSYNGQGDPTPKYGADLSFHSFTIDGAAPMVVEVGGKKVGPTNTMNMN
jgi:hypothetical protein